MQYGRSNLLRNTDVLNIYIKELSHQLKENDTYKTKIELAGRVFDDEYDLILAIIKGIHNRGKQGIFYVERLMFN